MRGISIAISLLILCGGAVSSSMSPFDYHAVLVHLVKIAILELSLVLRTISVEIRLMSVPRGRYTSGILLLLIIFTVIIREVPSSVSLLLKMDARQMISVALHYF